MTCWCFDLVNWFMLFGFGFGTWGLNEGWRVERREGRREWMRGFSDQWGEEERGRRLVVREERRLVMREGRVCGEVEGGILDVMKSVFFFFFGVWLIGW
jgi:hypothetical protein